MIPEPFGEPLPKPTRLERLAEDYYKASIARIKTVERGRIAQYTCPEFREIREWMYQALGEEKAYIIFEKYL